MVAFAEARGYDSGVRTPESGLVCDAFYWPLQDANFNVTGLIDENGDLVERYEYTPYGERRAFTRTGSDDEVTGEPLYESRRVQVELLSGEFVPAAYGLCAFGHQGLMLDKEFGQYYNRHRQYLPRHRRFLTRDPAGYVEALSFYAHVQTSPVVYVDPTGLAADLPVQNEEKPWKEVHIGRTRRDEWRMSGRPEQHVLDMGNRILTQVRAYPAAGGHQLPYYAVFSAKVSRWGGERCSAFLIAFQYLRTRRKWQVYDAPELRERFRHIRNAAKKGEKITHEMRKDMQRLQRLGLQYNVTYPTTGPLIHHTPEGVMGGVTRPLSDSWHPRDKEGFLKGPSPYRVVCVLDKNSKLVIACVHFGWSRTPKGSPRNLIESQDDVTVPQGSGKMFDLGYPFKSILRTPSDLVKKALRTYENGKYAKYKFVNEMEKEWSR